MTPKEQAAETARISHIGELQRRSRTAQVDHFAALEAALGARVAACKDDPVQMMGLLRCLLDSALNLAYGTISTPGDMQFRTGEDFAGMASAHWVQIAQITEQMASAGNTEAQARAQLAPSDPSKRVIEAPKNAPPPEAGPLKSIADLFGDDEPEPANVVGAQSTPSNVSEPLQPHVQSQLEAIMSGRVKFFGGKDN